MNSVRILLQAAAALVLLALGLFFTGAASAGPPSNADAAAQMAAKAGVDPSRIEITSIVLVGTHQEGDEIIEEYQINYRVRPSVDIDETIKGINDIISNLKDKGVIVDNPGAPGIDPHPTLPAQTPPAAPVEPDWGPLGPSPLESLVVKAIKAQSPRPMTPNARASRARARENLMARFKGVVPFQSEDTRRWLDDDPTGYRLRLAYNPVGLAKGQAETFLEAEKIGRIHGPLEPDLFPDPLGLRPPSFVDENGAQWAWREAFNPECSSFLKGEPSYLHWAVDCRRLNAADCRRLEDGLSDLPAAERERFVLLFKTDKDR